MGFDWSIPVSCFNKIYDINKPQWAAAIKWRAVSNSIVKFASKHLEDSFIKLNIWSITESLSIVSNKNQTVASPYSDRGGIILIGILTQLDSNTENELGELLSSIKYFQMEWIVRFSVQVFQCKETTFLYLILREGNLSMTNHISLLSMKSCKEFFQLRELWFANFCIDMANRIIIVLIAVEYFKTVYEESTRR
jgi:hypothetical protein